MSSTVVLERQRARWYELIPHPVQLKLLLAVENGIRFPIVPAGRRSGKTERAKRFIARQALWYPNERYFAAAPTYAQAKKIWWNDLKALTFSAVHTKRPSESDLIIFMPNGTEIHVIGLDQPQRIEGVEWTGGVIDEIADVKSESLEANIMPALNTVNPTRPYYRAWCWFIGVPDGLNHFYDMAEYAKKGVDPDYALFHWTSEEILPPDVIESAKRTMSAKQYAQEYRASFETAGGRIYEDYSSENWCQSVALPHEALHWTHDQNFTPLSSAIIVVRNGCPHFVDEIVLESAVSRQSALEFVEKYKDHTNKMVYIYGDPAGRAGEKHGHKSDYTEIEDVLRLHNWKFERRVRPAAPAIKDRQNAVRARIRNAKGDIRMFVNPNKAVWCHKGLATVQLKEGSSFQEDDKNPYQHITTAIGYFVDYYWPAGRSTGGSAKLLGNF
jgi:Terminase large subunit, T4likevirus-type, N-terminal